MTHAELVEQIARRCYQRRLRCIRALDHVVKCPYCQRTIRRGDGQHASGWVDLVILGRGGALFVEVKSEDGRRTMPQVRMEGDVAAAGLWYRLWRPVDLASGLIDRELDNIA